MCETHKNITNPIKKTSEHKKDSLNVNLQNKIK